jgi:hypothetical protein
MKEPEMRQTLLGLFLRGMTTTSIINDIGKINLIAGASCRVLDFRNCRGKVWGSLTFSSGVTSWRHGGRKKERCQTVWLISIQQNKSTSNERRLTVTRFGFRPIAPGI